MWLPTRRARERPALLRDAEGAPGPARRRRREAGARRRPDRRARRRPRARAPRRARPGRRGLAGAVPLGAERAVPARPRPRVLSRDAGRGAGRRLRRERRVLLDARAALLPDARPLGRRLERAQAAPSPRPTATPPASRRARSPVGRHRMDDGIAAVGSAAEGEDDDCSARRGRAPSAAPWHGSRPRESRGRRQGFRRQPLASTPTAAATTAVATPTATRRDAATGASWTSVKPARVASTR